MIRSQKAAGRGFAAPAPDRPAHKETNPESQATKPVVYHKETRDAIASI